MNHIDYRVLGINDSTIKTTSEEVVFFECSKVVYEDTRMNNSPRYSFDFNQLDNFILPKDSRLISWLEKAGPNEEIVAINLDDYELRQEIFKGDVRNNYYHKSLQIGKKTIKPAFGVGNIIFGLDSKEIENSLGSPTESKKMENSRQEIHIWIYETLGLKLFFSSDHLFFLERIQIIKNGYFLFGNDLIGMELEKLINNRYSFNLGDLKLSAQKSDTKAIYSSVEKKLVFEVINSRVESLYVMPIMKNNGFELEVQWPIPIENKGVVIPKEF